MNRICAWLVEWVYVFAGLASSVWHWAWQVAEDCWLVLRSDLPPLWLRFQSLIWAMVALALLCSLALILWKRRFSLREIDGDKQDRLFRLLYGSHSEASAQRPAEEEPPRRYRAFLRHLRGHLWYPNWILATGFLALLAASLLAGWIGALHSPSGAGCFGLSSLGKEFPAAILALLTGILIFSVGLDQDDVGFIGLSRAKVVLRHSYVFPVILLGLVSFCLTFVPSRAVALATVGVWLDILLFPATIFVLVRVCQLFSSPSQMNAAAHGLLLSYQRQSIWEEFGTVLRQEAFGSAIEELSGPELKIDFAQFGRLYGAQGGTAVPIPAAKSGIVAGFHRRELTKAIRSLRSGLLKDVFPLPTDGDDRAIGQATGPVRLVFWKQVGSSIDQAPLAGDRLWGELVFSTDLPARAVDNATRHAEQFGKKIDRGVFSVFPRRENAMPGSDVEVALNRSQSLFSNACMEKNPYDAQLVLDGLHQLYEDTLLLLGHAESVREQPTSPRSVALLDHALSEVVGRGLEAGDKETQHKVLYLPIRYALLWLERGRLEGFRRQLGLLEYAFSIVVRKQNGEPTKGPLLDDFMHQLTSLGLYYLPLPIRRGGDPELAHGAFRSMLVLYNRLMKHAFDSGADDTLAKIAQNVAREDRLWELGSRGQDSGHKMTETIALERKVVLFGFGSYLHMKAGADGAKGKPTQLFSDVFLPQLGGLSLQALADVLLTLESDGRDALYGWYHWDIPPDSKARRIDTSWPDRLFALMCVRQIEASPSDKSPFPINDHLYSRFREGGMIHSLVKRWADQGISFGGTDVSPESARQMLTRMEENVNQYKQQEDAQLRRADLSDERLETFVSEFLDQYSRSDGGVLAFLRREGLIESLDVAPPDPTEWFAFGQIFERDTYVGVSNCPIEGLGAAYGGKYANSQSAQLLAAYASVSREMQVLGTVGEALGRAVQQMQGAGSQVDNLLIVAGGDLSWDTFDVDEHFVPSDHRDWKPRRGDEGCEWQFKFGKYPRIPVLADYQSRSPGLLVLDRTRMPKTTIWSLPMPVAKGGKVSAYAKGSFQFVFADLKLAEHRDKMLANPPNWLAEMADEEREDYLSLRVRLRVYQAFAVNRTSGEFAVWLPLPANMSDEEDLVEAGPVTEGNPE
jgi:hypothetical protein